MSEVKVDKISPKTGTAMTVGDSGDTFTVPSGATLTVAGALNVTGTTSLADGTVAVAELDIDGATDIGAAIVDADLFVVDDGAGGTNRKTAASRIKTYVTGDNSIDSDQYVDGSIDNAHIADDAIDSEHYADGSIDTAHIADDQVTLAKMDGLARGKLIYGDSSGDPAALDVGTNGQALVSDGTDISWGSAGASTMNGLTDVSMDITNFVDGILIQTDTDGSAPGTGTLSSATGNIGIGKDVFAALTDGTYNTVIGYEAADALTGGDDNVIIGKNAGGATTTGNDNVYIGLDAGKTLTSAGQNIAIGSYAMDGATDLVCPNNMAIGYYAMSGALASGMTNNVAVGNYAFEDMTVAKYSTAVGFDAGKNVTTGYGNTCIGTFAGSVTITGDYNTYLGYGSNPSSNNTTRAIAIGQDVTAASSNFSVGKSGAVATMNFASNANWSHSSDERIKKNIEDDTLGLDFINDLRTRKFKWKPYNDVPEELKTNWTEGNEKDLDVTMHGFIAQEVKTAMDTAGNTTFEGWNLDAVDGVTQQTSREMFVMPLVKAMQELSVKVDALTTRVTTLEG